MTRSPSWQAQDEAERQFACAAHKLSKRVAAIEAALPGYLEQSRALADALSRSAFIRVGHWRASSRPMGKSKLQPTSRSRS